MKKSYFLKIFLLLAIVFTLYFIKSPKAYAATNPYPVNGYGYSGEWSNCTWSAWKIVHDDYGIELPAWGDAHNWFQNAKNAGYATGREARPNSIVCTKFSGMELGHVSVVTQVSGGQLFVKSGGNRIR